MIFAKLSSPQPLSLRQTHLQSLEMEMDMAKHSKLAWPCSGAPQKSGRQAQTGCLQAQRDREKRRDEKNPQANLKHKQLPMQHQQQQPQQHQLKLQLQLHSWNSGA